MNQQNLSLPSADVNRNFWRHSTPVNENCQASRSPPSTACAKRNFSPALCRTWRQQTILQKMHWCCDWPLLCFCMDKGTFSCYNGNRDLSVENSPAGSSFLPANREDLSKWRNWLFAVRRLTSNGTQTGMTTSA